VSDNLDLDPHSGRAQLLDANLGPDGPVVGHVLAEVLRHGGRHLVRQLGMVRVDAEDLRPALAAGVLEVELDIGEGLGDLGGDVLREVEPVGRGVPAA
jgi:hypothetical protein